MSIKESLIKLKWLPSHIFNKLMLRIHGFSYGKNLTTFGGVFVRGHGTVIIGNNVKITSCRETNPIGGDTKSIIYAKKNSQITIGNNVGISNTAIVAMNSIAIEDNVLIGGGCKIYDHDFHSLDYEMRMQPVDEGVASRPVLIKMGAFVGAHSIILKGVTIGEKSIVGAGSVVTKDIPDGEIWAGNPAKYIRSNEEI